MELYGRRTAHGAIQVSDYVMLAFRTSDDFFEETGYRYQRQGICVQQAQAGLQIILCVG
jgi:hypothetical protein